MLVGRGKYKNNLPPLGINQLTNIKRKCTHRALQDHETNRLQLALKEKRKEKLHKGGTSRSLNKGSGFFEAVYLGKTVRLPRREQ